MRARGIKLQAYLICMGGSLSVKWSRHMERNLLKELDYGTQ